MELLAIHFFTLIFNLFGVQSVPADFTQHWVIEKNWETVGNHILFQATSKDLGSYCATHPNEDLVFPQVVHSSQVVRVDGVPIATLGRPDHSAGSPFYQRLTVACAEITHGRELQWEVLSYSSFFSRLNESPYFTESGENVNFLNVTTNHLAFGILLVLSIFTFIVFRKRVPNRLTYSVSFGSLFLAIYFANASNLLMGLTMTMLISHKIADISVWIGIFLFYRAFEVAGYSSRIHFWSVRFFTLLGIGVIASGSTGDTVQFGTILPMLPMVMAFLSVIRQIGQKVRVLGWQPNLISRLFSVASFLVFGLNDICHVTGIINTGMALSFGIIGCIFGLAISVAQEVDQTYSERDELRTELEAWAPPFILKALKHDKIKFPIRKDLAAITYDIIDSSKYHDVFIEGRPIRAVLLQAFSEVIIRKGGWRESHSGDSAYAHFGILQNERPANTMAYQAAIEFRTFIEGLNAKHGVQIQCGIGLHLAQNVLINVHSIAIESNSEVVQQKSFDTTSSDIDLVHRIESFVHLLPGTNIAMSEKFMSSLDFQIEGLFELGTFKLKGQKELTTIFVSPNTAIPSQILKHYSSQSA